MSDISLVQPSQIDVTPKDQAQVDEETKLERRWHKKTPRYQTNVDIQDAYSRGELVKIGLTGNYRPISRLLNADTDLQFPPYLRPEAKEVLDNLAGSWRQKLTETFGNDYDHALLALTFLVGSEEYKNQLLNTPGKILNSEGTHSTGYTFDVDASSYYIQNGTEFFSCADPRRSVAIIQKNTENLIKIGGSKLHTLHARQEYEPRVTALLIEAAKELHASGKANLIIEYEGSRNRCLHICVKP